MAQKVAYVGIAIVFCAGGGCLVALDEPITVDECANWVFRDRSAAHPRACRRVAQAISAYQWLRSAVRRVRRPTRES